MPAFVQSLDVKAQRLFAAVRRPDKGRRPGSRPFPVHEENHHTAVQLLSQPLHDGQPLYIRKEGVWFHDVGIEPTADTIRDNDRGFAVPFRQAGVVLNAQVTAAVVGFKPIPVYVRRRVPIAGKEAQHRIIGRFVIRSFHAGVEAELQTDAPVPAVEIHQLRVVIRVVRAEIQAAALGQKSQKGGGDHARIQRKGAAAGIFRFVEYQSAAFAGAQIVHNGAFVVGPENGVVPAAVPKGILDGESRELQPFKLQRGAFHRGAPTGAAGLMALPHRQGDLKIFLCKAGIGHAITAGNGDSCARGRLLRRKFLDAPRSIAETDAEEGRLLC